MIHPLFYLDTTRHLHGILMSYYLHGRLYVAKCRGRSRISGVRGGWGAKIFGHALKINKPCPKIATITVFFAAFWRNALFRQNVEVLGEFGVLLLIPALYYWLPHTIIIVPTHTHTHTHTTHLQSLPDD